MSCDVKISSNNDSSSILKAQFTAENIPLTDDGIIQIMAGVCDFMNNNIEIWALFNDFRLGINISDFNLSDSRTHAKACYEIGLMFKKAMENFSLSTQPLDSDHFTFIGIFTLVLGSYPKAYAIVEQMIDAPIKTEFVKKQTRTLTH